MNPHMNLGKRFFIPQDQENGVVNNGDPWIPVTPQRPISSRPSLVPADMHGNQMERMNWQEPPRRILTGPDLVPSEMQGNQMERMNWQEPPRQILTGPDLVLAEMQGNQMGRMNWQEPQRTPILPGPNLIPADMQGNQMERTNWKEPQRQVLTGPDIVPAEMQLGNHQMERINQQEPQRPILPGPDTIPAEMKGNQMGKGNWQELIGIYEHLLQDSTEDTGKTQNVNPVERMDNTRAFQNTNSMVPKNLYNRELNHHWNNTLVESRSQNTDPYGQNVGHSRPAWNNCNTLAEVFGMRNIQTAHCLNATPDKNTYATGKPVTSNPCSQFEGSYRQCNTASPMLQKQAHSMSSSAVSDGYNRQYQPRGTLSSFQCLFLILVF